MADLPDELLTPEDIPSRSEGYSIRAKAGDDRTRALELADWHARQVMEIRRDLDAKRKVVERQIERLQHWLEAEEQRAKQDEQWHLAVLQQFMYDFPPPRGRTHRLPSGAVVRLRRSRGKTELVEEALMELCRQRDDLFNALVEFEPRLNRKAARQRFELKPDGTVVDKETGEQIGPVRYKSGNQEVVSPILVQREPPRDTVIVEEFSQEGDNDGDSQ